MANKKADPHIAWLLSFILPGLGLLYLGRKKAGILNFVLVNVVLLLSVAAFKAMEHIHYVLLALAAMSAGYACSVARRSTFQERIERATGSRDRSSAV